MKPSVTAIWMGAFFFVSATAFSSDGVDVPSQLQRDDGTSIHFYIDRATDNRNSETLLIALQGSDCNSVKQDAFIRDHAKNVWPSADMLLLEKPGITTSLTFSSNPERPDCPATYIRQDNPAQRVKDLKAVASEVLGKGKYTRVIAIGGSEGAVIVAKFAAETGLPGAAVLINGGGRWFLDDVLHNIRSTSSADTLQSDLKGFKGFAEQVLSSEPFDIEVSNHGYGWWRSMLTQDFQSVLGEIKVPVLIVQGERDVNVSPEAAIEMVNSLRKSGKTNLELAVYPDLNHALATPDGQYRTQQVLADINVWLKATLTP
jgi:pimeloyl-ACP methyl ester carboxylesterase